MQQFYKFICRFWTSSLRSTKWYNNYGSIMLGYKNTVKNNETCTFWMYITMWIIFRGPIKEKIPRCTWNKELTLCTCLEALIFNSDSKSMYSSIKMTMYGYLVHINLEIGFTFKISNNYSWHRIKIKNTEIKIWINWQKRVLIGCFQCELF